MLSKMESDILLSAKVKARCDWCSSSFLCHNTYPECYLHMIIWENAPKIVIPTGNPVLPNSSMKQNGHLLEADQEKIVTSPTWLTSSLISLLTLGISRVKTMLHYLAITVNPTVTLHFGLIVGVVMRTHPVVKAHLGSLAHLCPLFTSEVFGWSSIGYSTFAYSTLLVACSCRA